jgi:hypothetical protein
LYGDCHNVKTFTSLGSCEKMHGDMMSREQVEEHLGKRVAVYTKMGTIHVGYLQRSKGAMMQFETMMSPSHLEVESHNEAFTPWAVERIEVVDAETERRLRESCTCSEDDPHSWVLCPLHGPKGEHAP